MRRPLAEAYFNAYLDKSSVTRLEVEKWRLPVAAARLAEPIPEEAALILATMHALVQIA